MRNLRTLLLDVTAILIALPSAGGCLTTGGVGDDEVGSCDLRSRSTVVSPSVACAIASDPVGSVGYAYFENRACGAACGGENGGWTCKLPAELESYGNTILSSQNDRDAGSPPGCPAPASDVTVTCSIVCLGRATAGLALVDAGQARSAGEWFAACAALEAISVAAFDRLILELTAHGAPADLRGAARAAREDEVRHTNMMASLARRFGTELLLPSLTACDSAARSLFAIALENAVEGCVRETYGAVVALFGAAVATDAAVRDTLARIAEDEIAHATLGWQIAQWITPRLSAEERSTIQQSMASAARAIVEDDSVLPYEVRVLVGLPSREQRAHLFEVLNERLYTVAA